MPTHTGAERMAHAKPGLILQMLANGTHTDTQAYTATNETITQC